jgi:O-antigen/teichoic acid export membrane protein
VPTQSPIAPETEPQPPEPARPLGAAPSSRRGLAASIGRNTIFGIGSNIAQIGTRLFTVPIVIAHLGLDGYGIWAIVMTTAGYMRFGSVGIKSAFQKYVAEATGSGDYEKANRLLSTGSLLMLGLSIAGLVPTAIFSRNLAAYAGVPAGFLSAVAGAITLLAFIMMLSNAGAGYEAIVMGGHRIDLTRRFNMVFTVLEAIAIIIFLHFGFGLFTMAAIMAASEVGYVTCCYLAAHRVLPMVRIRVQYFTPGVIRELITYAGSYQLVNVLEVVYAAILPVTVLKFFGADAAGIYAIATRLSTAALLPQESVLLPLLSGGSMIYGSGSGENMRLLLAKAFKAVVALSLLPLAFIATFSGLLVFAWTGENASTLNVAMWLICIAGLFKAVAVLELVLYRISGKAFVDNLRQVSRIVILLGLSMFGARLGFTGILSGLVVLELFGMLLMFVAITRTFAGFGLRLLLPDLLKIAASAMIIMAAGWTASKLPIPWHGSERLLATLHLGVISLACAVSALPAFYLTRAISTAEFAAIKDSFLKRAHAAS